VTRRIDSRYEDPLDLIWLACARELGLNVTRSDEVYASFDGQRTLTLSTREHFDADDSLAQLVLHELCHALVAGPERSRHSDWGMENVDQRDLLDEHACHRLQAKLAERHGLRDFFAVTTDHRTYWDALPADPLGPGDDPAIPRAREAYARATRGPWSAAIERALEQTARLAELVRASAPAPDSLWARTRPLHASGFPLGDDPALRCADCGFGFRDGGVLRCRKTRALPECRGLRVSPEAQACTRFEPPLTEHSCARCGACCREAFDRVEVRARDLVKKHHPELVVLDCFGPHLARPGGSCVALERTAGAYRCRIYPARPRACAEFEIAGDACLAARRRVGLSA
jgi:hypothetical protein